MTQTPSLKRITCLDEFQNNHFATHLDKTNHIRKKYVTSMFMATHTSNHG